MKNAEIKALLEDLRYPLLITTLMWMVKLIEFGGGINLGHYGLYPRQLYGIQGIVTTVFLHGDWKHLFNNSVPMLLLGWSLFHFYKEVAWKVLLWVILMGGFWTWISARENLHIGASGLVYGLFSFLLVSGFIRKHKQLISISFLVAFLYGSLVWGLLPIDYKISWESHFWGFVAGIALAIYYRKVGKQRQRHQWDEEEEAILDKMDYWKLEKDKSNDPPFRIVFKAKSESKN
ncbi:MAG: rhomboid family intramembrane serine protease [Vicingaceae bacterium]